MANNHPNFLKISNKHTWLYLTSAVVAIIITITLISKYFKLKSSFTALSETYTEHLSQFQSLSAQNEKLSNEISFWKKQNNDISSQTRRLEDELTKELELEASLTQLVESSNKELKAIMPTVDAYHWKHLELQLELDKIIKEKTKLYNKLSWEHSHILGSRNEVSSVLNYLGNNYWKVKFVLCYASDIDDFNSSLFLSQCMMHTPTLTWYESTKTRFGGFTYSEWEDNEEVTVKYDETTIVFNIDMNKVYYKREGHPSILTGRGYLPCFGNLDFCMTDFNSVSKFPSSFGKEGEYKSLELVDFDNKLKMKRIEVYYVRDN